MSRAGRTRVAVLGGGRSSEHDVSVTSAASVAAALPAERFEVVPLTIARDGTWCDAGGPPLPGGFAGAVARLSGCDVVFPTVHGPHGEDGVLAALCDLAGLPCVGSPTRAGALAMDKWATKAVAAAAGVAGAPGVLLHPGDGLPQVSGPVVVKPVAAGSSHGVSRVDDPADRAALAAAVAAARVLDDRVLVEDLVVGREVDVAVLRRRDGALRVGPPLEVVVGDRGLFDRDAKYDGSAAFRVPAPLSGPQLTGLRAAAVAVVEALRCDGVARVDFFVTGSGCVLNEVNTAPGLTALSQVPRIFAADGLPYPALLEELVAGALARGPRPPGTGRMAP